MASSSSTVGEPVQESSRCITTMERTATLNFEVTDYPQLEGKSVGEYVCSRTFRAGGYDWRIHFYPSGCNKSCAGEPSAFLHYLSQARDVIAKYELNVQGKGGQAPVARFAPRVQVFYPGQGCNWGYHRFVAKSKLKSLSRLGGFTIQCILTTISTITKRNESPPLELTSHLERLLADGTGADVTFGVGGREFRAHRNLLAARSPVFHAQFFGPCSMMEKDMLRVEVVDVEPTIFEMLLRYIYTDSLPRCEDEGGYNVAVMQHLMVAADRYNVDRLKLTCEVQLCDKINMDTITTMFALANQHHCKQLKGACLTFMASSPEVLGTILESDGLKEHFMANCCPLPLDRGSSEDKR
ncbi:unnamed protein product [Alopecurus aequalis]